jgi:hypothetical protein
MEYGTYTRLTIWTRVAAFYAWGIEAGKIQGPNAYWDFYRDKVNKKLFRGAYKRNPCKQSFDEIMVKLQTIECPVMRNTAIVQMTGGLRFCELFTINGNEVLGKGRKIRKVYLPDPIGPLIERNQYSAYLKQLKQFGLTTHKLRHARMTHFVEQGATLWELRKFAGWGKNSNMAESYITARDERIGELATRSIKTERKVETVMSVLKLLARTVREQVKL